MDMGVFGGLGVLFVAVGLPIVLAVLIRKFGADWGRGKTVAALLAANTPFYILVYFVVGGEMILWSLYIWPIALANMVPSFAIGLLFREWSQSEAKGGV